MAVTNKQLEANQKNAQKSTGPVTTIGKAKVSTNAVKHGVLSNKLVLPQESEEDFQFLFDDLVSSIKPVGALAFSLVEMIAINLFKQRRLIRAETAEISLLNRPERIARRVNLILNYPSDSVSTEEIKGLDPDYCDFCEPLMPEIDKAEYINTSEELKSISPILFKRLTEDAEQDEVEIDEYVNNDCGGMYEYIQSLKNFCNKYQRRHEIAELANLERDKNSVLFGDTEKTHARYQTTLNNEFHKLVSTLRDVMKMQSHFIDI